MLYFLSGALAVTVVNQRQKQAPRTKSVCVTLYCVCDKFKVQFFFSQGAMRTLPTPAGPAD